MESGGGNALPLVPQAQESADVCYADRVPYAGRDDVGNWGMV